MRERLMVSFFLAVVVHVLAFLILQQLIRIERERLPERIGPIVVELAEVPVPAQVRERPPEPRREPAPQQPPEAVQRETPAAPVTAPAARPAAAPSTAPAARPRVAPGVPTPKPQPEESPLPRTSTRTQPRALPTEPSGTEPAPAVRTPQAQPQQPAYNQPVTVPKEQEVRPEAGTTQPSLLDMSRVDTALGGSSPGTAAPASGGAPGGAAAGTSPAAGVTSGAAPEDYSIEWTRPEQGREAISTPAPVIPAWVSRQGTRLQISVSFVLTADGLLREVKVERSSGYSDVDAAVLEALRRWRFRPAPGSRDVSGLVRYSILPR